MHTSDRPWLEKTLFDEVCLGPNKSKATTIPSGQERELAEQMIKEATEGAKTEIIPECIQRLIPEIQNLIKVKPEDIGMRHHSIVEGVTIHYSESIKPVGSNAVDKFMVEYSVKGPNPEYVLQVIRDSQLMKHWCPLFAAVLTVSFLDNVSDLLDIKGTVSLFGPLAIPTKLRVFRSAFYDK
jgi:hypothetical protein